MQKTLINPGQVRQRTPKQNLYQPKEAESINTNTRKMKIVFCLTGSIFPGKFLDCWTETLPFCFSRNIQPILSRKESSNIYFVRNMALGADVSRGEDQKPFNGQLDYDYIMWIDSDILFHPEQILRLISHNKDIVSGIYMMSGGNAFATVKDWDEEYFKQNGCFKFLTPEDIKDQKDLIEVSYTGMGFMLIKKGVFESMKYPWFRPIEKRIGSMTDYTSEDVSFAIRAKENGYKVFIDPTIRVGHEKKIVL